MITPRTPSGIMELLPRQQVAFQDMLDTIRRVYESFGFLPVETPAFEMTDVLLTKEGGETEKQVYFVQSTGSLAQGEKPDMALHFDLTVPLARYVAQYERDLAFPFRRYQIQRSYRGERPQKGRFREFYQCDVDIIGKDSLPLSCDTEMPAILYQAFTALKIGAFRINTNNRKLLSGLFEGFGIAPGEKQQAALRAIDKLDKVGKDGVRKALVEEGAGLDLPRADALLDLVTAEGSNDDTLKALEKTGIDNLTFQQGLQELKEFLAGAMALGVPDTVLRVNLSIARGLDYYTGMVYEVLLDDLPNFGSVGSGGRYENLAGQYTRSSLPGVGISIGATRLFAALLELGRFGDNEIPSPTQVLVTFMDPALSGEYLKLAADLRAQGINTETYPEPAKLAKQIKHADRLGIPFVAMIGSDEMAAGTVTLKDMRQGTQETLPRTALAGRITA
ncbi:MAG: histidine--tRNA ligase [Pseudomonadota bacterium]|nr:histidine--tRNA ligase [Pseudomonadota bacterium]